MRLPKLLLNTLTGCLAWLLSGCGEEPSQPKDAIVIGALLPFTGKEAAIGRNLEQAMLLAIRDVNDAGGVAGRPLALVSRDSNSGSARGFEELLQLLYVDEVAYLVGPEENELANAIIPDVKALDVLNILPGYAAPLIQRSSTSGAWVRLAPSPTAIACGMAWQAFDDGARTTNAIVSTDDYNMNVAADFSATFSHMGGTSLPLVTVQAGASSYARQIRTALDYGADRTLLIAYPATASRIATEWTILGRRGNWYLTPMLHTEVLLVNTPFGALRGYRGLSPSLSLSEECTRLDPSGEPVGDLEDVVDPDTSLGQKLTCTRHNASDFAEHFAARWSGDRPLPAAHFYYDAVVLLALGLERTLAGGGAPPSATRLRDAIKTLGDGRGEHVSWRNLRDPLAAVASGADVTYVGAASEYRFNAYGVAQHTIFDTWQVSDDGFEDTGSLLAACPRRRQ